MPFDIQGFINKMTVIALDLTLTICHALAKSRKWVSTCQEILDRIPKLCLNMSDLNVSYFYSQGFIDKMTSIALDLMLAI